MAGRIARSSGTWLDPRGAKEALEKNWAGSDGLGWCTKLEIKGKRGGFAELHDGSLLREDPCECLRSCLSINTKRLHVQIGAAPEKGRLPKNGQKKLAIGGMAASRGPHTVWRSAMVWVAARHVKPNIAMFGHLETFGSLWVPHGLGRKLRSNVPKCAMLECLKNAYVDARFLSHFWLNLWKVVDTQLQFSNAYQPQTDWQIEGRSDNIQWGAILYWDYGLARIDKIAFMEDRRGDHNSAPACKTGGVLINIGTHDPSISHSLL
ncbi:hypothetical protein CRG98_026974 [Punica granatum]|uniref:Uncharacterized protein n=1 Tax=Punica granatum TaxID=22663 RepID=A0A2I0J8Q9_PUNGR|nr:hypothetical protein CRG98_026974 [Punica granatum]